MNPVPVPVEQTPGGEDLLREEARRLLAPFKFHASQKREVFAAFKANPDGVERCALRAKAAGQRSGTTGAGLLLSMIRFGEHELEPNPDAQRPTGWRWVRGDGGASGTFIEDPEGVDKLPPGYDFTPSPTYGAAPRTDGWEPQPLTDEVRAQVFSDEAEPA